MNILNYLKDIRMNYVCGKYLSVTSGDIGKWTISKDTITCHVDQEKLDKVFGRCPEYFLILNTPNNYGEKVDEYTLDGVFHYIFEDITFDKPITLECNNGVVIFKNCVFTNGISFNNVDNVIFEDNIYDIASDMNPFSSMYLNGQAKSVKFINENFFDYSNSEKDFLILILSDDLTVNGTTFYNPLMNLHLESKNSRYENVNIKANYAAIDSDEFVGHKLSVSADREFVFNVRNYQLEEYKFDSPIVRWIGRNPDIPNSDYESNVVIKQKKVR